MDTTPAMRPMNRRLFLKGAALALVGLTVFGIDAPMRARATEATLNALSDAQAEYDAAMAELQNITSQLETAEYELAECQANLDATNQQIAETEAAIAAKQEELAAAQDVLAERIRANYTSGATELIDVLFSATTFEDFVSRLYYAGKVTDADAEAIQDVKDLKAELEGQQAALEEQRAQQEQLVAEQQQLTDELSGTQAYLQEYTAGLSTEVTTLMEQARAEEEAARLAAEELAVGRPAAAGDQPPPLPGILFLVPRPPIEVGGVLLRGEAVYLVFEQGQEAHLVNQADELLPALGAAGVIPVQPPHDPLAVLDRHRTASPEFFKPIIAHSFYLLHSGEIFSWTEGRKGKGGGSKRRPFPYGLLYKICTICSHKRMCLVSMALFPW